MASSDSRPPPLALPRTEMWIEERTRSIIYLRTVTGGGHGFLVTLATDVKSVGRDYLRESYHVDLLWAMERIVWLMDNIVTGTWSRVPQNQPATECDPPVTR